MAFCPQCHRELHPLARFCKECGYAFPSRTAVLRDRLAFGKWADLALLLGQTVCLLGALLLVLSGLAALYHLQWKAGAFLFFYAVVLYAFFITFARVQARGD